MTLNNRGNTRRDKGDLEGRALQDFDEAIRLKPDYAGPRRTAMMCSKP